MQSVLSNYISGRRTVRNIIPTRQYTLQQHQSIVRSHMRNHDRLLVVHGTGSGKTLTAAHVAKDYTSQDPANNIVIFVTPKAVQSQFRASVMSVLAPRPGIYFTTYDGLTIFLHKLYTDRHETFRQIVSHAMIIADEAHYITDKTEKSRVFYDIFKSADKVMLMTGTPIINGKPEDLLPYARILNPNKDISKQDVTKGFAKFFKCKISLYKVPTNSQNFPRMSPSENIAFNLTNNQANRLEKSKITKSTRGGWPHNRGIMSYRVYGNDNQPKFKKFMEIFRDRPHKTIVFFKEYETLNLFSQFLKSKNIFHREISGRTKNKSETIAKDGPRARVVYLLTSAAKEGLDFKGVRTVIFMDYPWVPSDYDQIIGRARRYQSHINLPANQRNVKVYNLIYKNPINRKPTINSRSRNILKNKQTRINLMTLELMSVSIEQSMCPADPVRIRNLKPVANRVSYRPNRTGTVNKNYANNASTGMRYHAAALNIPYNRPIIKKVNRNEFGLKRLLRSPGVRTPKPKATPKANNKILTSIKTLFKEPVGTKRKRNSPNASANRPRKI